MTIEQGEPMSFDDLKSKWLAHDHGIPLDINAELLLREVRRNHRALELQLWQRDFGEVVAAALITAVFATLAVSLHEWSLLLCAAGSLVVGCFFVVDRWRQRLRRSSFGDSLISTIEASLLEVEHQIWLLRNILWWYLLPLVPGIVTFLATTSWQASGEGLAQQVIIVVVGFICAAAFWSVYRINQREVKVTLEPRRIELEELRSRLDSSDRCS
ncbi:MAG: hypothetical protein JNL67_20875 [Planctomycetaceae bacterium]|nr:hypothetical protein [Planctomycetaceae bacterium]